MSLVAEFEKLITVHGSDVTYHRTTGLGVTCPCVSPEGFRDPEWHDALAAKMGALVGYTADFQTGGVIDAVNHSVSWYVVAAFGGNPIGIPVNIANVGPAADSYNVTFTNLTVVSQPGIDSMILLRSVDGGPLMYLAVIHPGDVQWIDNQPVGYVNPIGAIPEICNEQGLLAYGQSADPVVKAFIHPAQSTRMTRLADEYLQQIFGEIQSDDHVGVFPCQWKGNTLNFRDWSQSGSEYVIYDERKFTVVNANLIPDPSDGNPYHHWEVALRLIS